MRYPLNGLSPAQLDALYDNRALVPEHPQHLKEWADRSLAARASAACHLDLPYGNGSHETLDIFLPEGAGRKTAGAPVLVFIHGGYWRALDKSDHSFVAPTFTRQGVCVVVVNYALCPGPELAPVRIPSITLQMVKALVWVHRHIAAYGGHPDQITVAGHSAGGHLAAMMLACQWSRVDPTLPDPLVRQGVAISGVFDLEPLRRAPSFQVSLQLDEHQVNRASPARLPVPGEVQLTALVGGIESAEFLRQNAWIRQCWGADAVPVCATLPGLNHFSVVQTLMDPTSALSGHMMDAIASSCR